MTTLKAPTEVEARLARIEAALVQGSGLLGCLQVVNGVPEGWKSQVEEKKKLLEQATIDVILLEGEIVR